MGSAGGDHPEADQDDVDHLPDDGGADRPVRSGGAWCGRTLPSGEGGCATATYAVAGLLLRSSYGPRCAGVNPVGPWAACSDAVAPAAPGDRASAVAGRELG